MSHTSRIVLTALLGLAYFLFLPPLLLAGPSALLRRR